MTETGALLLALAAIFAPLVLVWAVVELQSRKPPCRPKKQGK
jgi:hypothetical protein